WRKIVLVPTGKPFRTQKSFRNSGTSTMDAGQPGQARHRQDPSRTRGAAPQQGARELAPLVEGPGPGQRTGAVPAPGRRGRGLAPVPAVIRARRQERLLARQFLQERREWSLWVTMSGRNAH